MTSIVSAPGTAEAQEETSDTDTRGPIPRILGFLQGVLDDLVGDETITQDQADAIVQAAEEKAAEVREEHRELRDLVKELLEDGVGKGLPADGSQHRVSSARRAC